jgi:hypothetical protein
MPGGYRQLLLAYLWRGRVVGTPRDLLPADHRGFCTSCYVRYNLRAHVDPRAPRDVA